MMLHTLCWFFIVHLFIVISIHAQVTDRWCNRPSIANSVIFPSAREINALRIMSYNIRGDFTIDKENGNAWDIRKHKIQVLINHYQPDIIGLQEVHYNYLTDLDNMFPDYTLAAFPATEFYADAALLFRTTRFTVKKINYFWISENPYESALPAWGASIPRILVYAILQDNQSDIQYCVLCTHFDSTAPESRIQGAQLIVQQQQRLAGEHIPVVIVGDFNLIKEKQGQEAYNEFVRNNMLQDVRDLAHESHYGPDGTWIGWPYDAAAVAPGTVGARLDQIFGRNLVVIREGVLNLKVTDAGTLISEQDEGYDIMPYPSDHLPLIADICLLPKNIT